MTKPNFVVAAGTTQTTPIDMSGTDTLTVEATGLLLVSSNAQTVRFNGPTTNGQISNSGTIESAASGGRAIRIETSVGATFTATINNTVSGIIRSGDDAIQVQAGSVTGGTITLINAGLISSTGTGQGLDFAGATGAAIQSISNSGQINAAANDAIRIGGVGTITNTGTIDAGTLAGYQAGADGIQFEDSSSGTVNNNGSGVIAGDRHGVNAGLNTSVIVNNAPGATITGRNGSGIGLDGSGSVTNHGTITGNFSNSAGSDVNGTTVGRRNGGGPDGILDGDGDGIDIDGQATINNHGTIQGTGAGGSGSDGRLNTSEGIAAGGGTINNFAGAMISGLGLGILIDDSSTGNAPFATFISNDGTIQGVQSVGIRLIDEQNDTIANSGTISGGNGIAIQMGGGNDRLFLYSTSVFNGLSDGQGGSDTLDYTAQTAGVTVDMIAGTATSTGGIAGFENVVGSAHNDTFIGDAGDNVFLGNDGVDRLNGGAGSDTASYFGHGAVQVDLSNQYAWDGGSMDFFTSIENAIGSINSDILVGSAGDNILEGGEGVDFIQGGGGSDTTSYRSWGSGVQVDLNAQYSWDGLSMDFLSSIENAIGSAQNDILVGDGNDNILEGLGGVDSLQGGGGNDTASYRSSASGVVVDLVSQNSWDGTSMDFFTSIESAIGSGMFDTLFGTSGANRFEGLGGNDIIVGNGGDDTFVYSAAGSGNDSIMDFDADAAGGQDLIDVSGRGFNAGSIGSGILVTAINGGADTLVTIGSDTIRLVGVVSTNIDQTDFIF